MSDIGGSIWNEQGALMNGRYSQTKEGQKNDEEALCFYGHFVKVEGL